MCLADQKVIYHVNHFINKFEFFCVFIWFLCQSCYYESIVFLAAAAAKSLQSCPTLCDPRDGSPPGSLGFSRQEHVQVGSKALICVDEGVLSYVLLWSGSPERCQLWSHVPTLIINMLVTGWHLLDGIDVHVYVCGGVGCIHDLPEGKYKASRWILSECKENCLLHRNIWRLSFNLKNWL